MSSIKEICRHFGITPTKYTLLKNVTIVESDKECLVIKKKFRDKKELYSYLSSRSFSYYPELLYETEDYEVYPYLEDVTYPTEQRSLDLIYLMSLLHNKTTFYKEVDLDSIKAFYEEKTQEIDYLFQYYQGLQDAFERNVYMSPGEYLLLYHISFLYHMLLLSKDMLERFQKQVMDSKRQRYAMVHHRLTLDHFRKSNVSCFISWDHASLDLPIYDFYYFYQENDRSLDYMSLLEVYMQKYPLLESEMLQLFVLLSIPRKLYFQKEEYEVTKEIYLEIKRLKKVEKMVLKYQEKYRQKQK